MHGGKIVPVSKRIVKCNLLQYARQYTSKGHSVLPVWPNRRQLTSGNRTVSTFNLPN